MSRYGRWQCSQVIPGDRVEREGAAGLIRRLRTAVNSGDPRPPLFMVKLGLLQERQFSYSVCSQIGVTPWSQISG